MSGTIYVSPTACSIDGTGVHAPSLQTIIDYLVGRYLSIYGSDTYLGNDSQDYELLAVFAQAIDDANSVVVATYNAFSPATAQGAGLSSVVKLNGIQRLVPSNSSVDLLCVGQAGTTIIHGIAVDASNNRWFLPSPITIPISGQITVTAIAEFSGAIQATPGTINKIGNVTNGWQSVTNLANANVGAPVELDGQLRQRQSVSTMLPAQSVLDGIVGAIYQLAGVTRVQAYENKTSLVDSNGVPAHSIALVVEGGSAQAIGNVILLKKTPGTGTYGTTSVTSYDSSGNPNTINFFRPTIVPITAIITLTPLLGYTTDMGVSAISAVTTALSRLPIGADVVRTRMIAAAYATLFQNYSIVDVQQARGNALPADTDIPIAFNEAATGSSSTVSIVFG